jgi:hypothetical protein
MKKTRAEQAPSKEKIRPADTPQNRPFLIKCRSKTFLFQTEKFSAIANFSCAP